MALLGEALPALACIPCLLLEKIVYLLDKIKADDQELAPMNDPN